MTTRPFSIAVPAERGLFYDGSDNPLQIPCPGQVVAQQTFTVAPGDLLDVSATVPASARDLGLRLVRAAVGMLPAGITPTAPTFPAVEVTSRSGVPADVELLNGVEYASNGQRGADFVDSTGGTWRPPATLWTRAAGYAIGRTSPVPVTDFVDAGTGFLRLPSTTGDVLVTVYLLLQQYPDTAATAARQAAGMAALAAERAVVAAQRAAQTGQWH